MPGVNDAPGAQDVLALTGRGLALFLLPPGRTAAEPGWQQACTTDLTSLARSWPPAANVGVRCRASCLVGLDLDRHGGPDGVATFARLCAAHGAGWPATLTVATPHGGLHLYFRAPAGAAVGSPIGRWPGVDVRGPGLRTGGYLAGPGSLVDGRCYVIVKDAPIAGLPRWLRPLLAKPGPE